MTNNKFLKFSDVRGAICDAFMDHLDTYKRSEVRSENLETMMSLVANIELLNQITKNLYGLPTIDAADERKLAHWTTDNADNGWLMHECSNCGYTYDEDVHVRPFHFCPECGCRMYRSRIPEE